MKRLLIVIALCLTLPFMTACHSGEAEQPGTTQSGQVDTGYGDSHIIPDNEYYVKKFVIDGTTCVIFNDGGAGGLSCDWPAPVPTPTATDPYYPTESPTP